MYRGPILFPLVLIVLGFLLLFSNLGYIQFDFWQFRHDVVAAVVDRRSASIF